MRARVRACVRVLLLNEPCVRASVRRHVLLFQVEPRLDAHLCVSVCVSVCVGVRVRERVCVFVCVRACATSPVHESWCVLRSMKIERVPSSPVPYLPHTRACARVNA